MFYDRVNNFILIRKSDALCVETIIKEFTLFLFHPFYPLLFAKFLRSFMAHFTASKFAAPRTILEFETIAAEHSIIGIDIA